MTANSPIDLFLAHLDKIFQVEPEFYAAKKNPKGIPGVSTLVYRDIPEPGMVTGITYGLSLIEHPEWKNNLRNELMITVQSKEVDWAHVAGFIANELRGKCPFAYSNTINLGHPIAKDSKLDALLVFAPSIIAKEHFLNIDVGTSYQINLAGLYPIYASEMEVINQKGLKHFWDHPNFDLYRVDREPVQD